MTHPGVGPVTALATDVFVGDSARFPDGKAVASYVGMTPERVLQRHAPLESQFVVEIRNS